MRGRQSFCLCFCFTLRVDFTKLSMFEIGSTRELLQTAFTAMSARARKRFFCLLRRRLLSRDSRRRLAFLRVRFASLRNHERRSTSRLELPLDSHGWDKGFEKGMEVVLARCMSSERRCSRTNAARWLRYGFTEPARQGTWLSGASRPKPSSSGPSAVLAIR